MSERYWITGVQLGVIKALIQDVEGTPKMAARVLQEVENNQFIGNMEEPHEDHEIIIKKKRA